MGYCKRCVDYFPTLTNSIDICPRCAYGMTLKPMTAAEVEPVRHGRWIDAQEDDKTEGLWICNSCGSEFYFAEGHPSEYGCYYCPNCGAKMDGGIDNGDAT